MPHTNDRARLHFVQRRDLLKSAAGLTGLPLLNVNVLAAEPNAMRPQAGDVLVFVAGDRKGEPIKAESVPVGAAPLMAMPMEPGSRTVRDGSRLNTVLLVRPEPDSLNEETRGRSAEGIVAYSAICTHQGCEVGAWDAETKTLWCPCHDSKYDPRESGRVVGGPATKRLATLPLKVVDGVLTVAGGFSGPVGFQTR